MKEFIANNLMLIHSGTISQKLTGAFLLSFVPSVGVSLTEHLTQWYIDNHAFMLLLFGAILADLIIGMWKHLQFSTFSFKKLLTGFTTKCALILVVYFLMESFIQITIDYKIISSYISTVFKLILWVYPSGNALVNIGTITGGKFPPIGLLKKFEKFNKDLNINAFKEEKEQNDEE